MNAGETGGTLQFPLTGFAVCLESILVFVPLMLSDVPRSGCPETE